MVTQFLELETHFPWSLDQVSTQIVVYICLGILETIFDGIQRPLKEIAGQADSVFIPRGIELPCLDQDKLWDFHPSKTLKVGDLITGGDQLGYVNENSLF